MLQFLLSLLRRVGISLGLIDERARMRRYIRAWFEENGHRRFAEGRSYAADRARYLAQ